MAEETKIIALDAAEALIRDALTAAGVAASAARSVARALAAAEAEGQVGHGFSRLDDYIAQARSGKVDPTAEPTVTETGAAAAVVDAGDGFAYPALDLAIDWIARAAHAQGAAAASVTRSHHCGALSIQVEKIAQRGLVGLMVANAPAAIAPWGAKTPVFGTNPIAFAAPRQDAAPLVIDLSLSRVARGKVMHARKSGEEIPLGWALDQHGAPTTDPEAALAGTMLPIGEAKGAALALMVEILAAAFTGANLSSEVSSFFTADGPPSGAGQFLLALRPHDNAAFLERLEALLSSIAALDGARLPGARRAEALERARVLGIEVPKRYLEAAQAAAGGRFDPSDGAT